MSLATDAICVVCGRPEYAGAVRSTSSAGAEKQKDPQRRKKKVLSLEWWQLLLIIMGAGSLGAVIMGIIAGGGRHGQ